MNGWCVRVWLGGWWGWVCVCVEGWVVSGPSLACSHSIFHPLLHTLHPRQWRRFLLGVILFPVTKQR